MSIPTCSTHQVLATRRCPACHKPLCSRCRDKDGCCSERCYKRRAGFWAPVAAGHRGRRWGIKTILLLLVGLAGLAFAVARHLGLVTL